MAERSLYLNLRLSPEEREQLRRLAEASGETVSAFVRRWAALLYAEKFGNEKTKR